MLDIHHRVAFRLRAILSSEIPFKGNYWFSVGTLSENEFIVRVTHQRFIAKGSITPNALPGATQLSHFMVSEDSIHPLPETKPVKWHAEGVETLYRITFKDIMGELVTRPGEARAHRHNDTLSIATCVAGAWTDLDSTQILKEIVRTVTEIAPPHVSAAMAFYGRKIDYRTPPSLAWVLDLCHDIHKRLLPDQRFMSFAIYPQDVGRARRSA